MGVSIQGFYAWKKRSVSEHARADGKLSAQIQVLYAALVTTELARAVARRRLKPGLIVYTDQGVQYAFDPYRRALRLLQTRQNMGTKGDCWDNAVAESFFHSFTIEAVYGSDIETRRGMEYEVFEYIERFYNRNRKHSALGLRSPVQFEAESFINQKAAA